LVQWAQLWKSINPRLYNDDDGVTMAVNGRIKGVISSSIVAILIAVIFISLPSDVVAHAPESLDLSYDYFTQTLNVTIQHSGYQTQHYIENIEVFKNDVSVIDETYTEQAELRDLYYEFEVFAEDGDVLKVIATCNLVGDDEGDIIVDGPKDRMTIQINEIDEIEMGDEFSFTVNIKDTDSEEYIEGVNVEVRVWEGVVTEVDDLGIGGYAFTYTAPELQDEVVEVINITASRNGYHTQYFEFDFDILFPVDPDKKIHVTLTPAFSSINEGETKELTVTVEAGDQPLDITGITVERSGGIYSDEVTGVGTFLLTFKANEVGSDVNGWIKVTASKEGYSTGTAQLSFKIKDTSDPADDDDDDTSVNNNSGLITPTNFIIVVVIILVIAAVVGFFVWRSRRE
jgi:desulfoferrodoxin (superoxide reductase-like protein)